MPTQLLFTRFLNAHFAAPVTGLLRALHVHVLYPNAPITNAFSMELLVFAALLLYFIAVRATLSVEKPAAVQHVAEMTHGFVLEQSENIIGHGSEKFVGYLTVIGALHPAQQPDGPGSGARVADRRCRCAAWFRARDVRLLPLSRHQIERVRLCEAVSGPGADPLPAAAADRNHLAPGACPFPDGPFVRQHVCWRHDHAGVLFAGSDRYSARLSWGSTLGWRLSRLTCSCCWR